jgi:hypothetical protein
LEGIRAGTKLRQSNKTRNTPGGSGSSNTVGHGDLLAQIRQSKKLRKVPDKKRDTSGGSGSSNTGSLIDQLKNAGGVMAAIRGAMDKRRAATNYDDDKETGWE